MTEDVLLAQVKEYYDRAGKSLTIWFGDLKDEYVCEETGDQVILMKGKSRQVSGSQKLSFLVSKPSHSLVAFETVAA